MFNIPVNRTQNGNQPAIPVSCEKRILYLEFLALLLLFYTDLLPELQVKTLEPSRSDQLLESCGLCIKGLKHRRAHRECQELLQVVIDNEKRESTVQFPKSYVTGGKCADSISLNGNDSRALNLVKLGRLT